MDNDFLYVRNEGDELDRDTKMMPSSSSSSSSPNLLFVFFVGENAGMAVGSTGTVSNNDFRLILFSVISVGDTAETKLSVIKRNPPNSVKLKLNFAPKLPININVVGTWVWYEQVRMADGPNSPIIAVYSM